MRRGMMLESVEIVEDDLTGAEIAWFLAEHIEGEHRTEDRRGHFLVQEITIL